MEEAFIGLRRAVKDLAFYPSGHPALAHSLERTVRQVEALLTLTAPLTLTVEREGFRHQQTLIGSENIQIRQFASDIYFAGIRKIHITTPLRAEDLTGFLSLLLHDVKEIRAAGGARQFLSDKGVTNPTVEDLAFTLDEEETAPLELTPAYDPASSMPAIPLEKEKSLEELLTRLEETTSIAEYQNLAERIEAMGTEVITGKDTDLLIRILSTFGLHTHETSVKSPQIKQQAWETLQRINERGALPLLMDVLCAKDITREDDLAFLLISLGEPAVEALLTRLSNEPNLTARRRLLDTVVLLGPIAVPALLKALDEPRWYVLRNIILLLGRIGGEATVVPLLRHLRHKDHRVRREVVKALGQVGSRRRIERVLSALVELVHDPDEVVCQMAVSSLGALRDPRAVPVLAGLTLTTPSRGPRLDLSKAAILSLGLIGGKAAEAVLLKLLYRRGWFRRKGREEIRIGAASALGMLGTPEALLALEEVALRSEGHLRHACEQAAARARAGETKGT